MSEAPAATRWQLVLLLLSAGVVCALQVGKVPMALPAIRAELDLSLTGAGWLLSMISVLGMVSGVAVGYLGDRLGHRRVILLCLWSLVVANIAGAAADGIGLLLVTRFIEGIGLIGVSASVPSLLIRVSRPADMRMVMGIWGGYFPIGVAVMVLLSPPLLALTGWRGVWLANAVVSLAFIALFAVATASLKRSGRVGLTAGTAISGIWRTVSSPGPLLLALSFGAYAGIFLAVMGFLPTLLTEVHGLSGGARAAMTAGAVVINAAGSIVGAWALQRGAPRWQLMLAGFVAIAACTVGVYTALFDQGLRYVLVVALSFIGGVIPGCCFAGAPVHSPTPALVATTNGLIIQGSAIGQVISPPTVAVVVAAWGGWQAAPLVLVALAGIGAMLSIGIRWLERPNRRVAA